MNFLFKILHIIIFFSLIGCAGGNDPYGRSRNFVSDNCADIRTNIERLEYEKKEIRKNDRFMVRYMFVIPAILHVMRMDKETKRVDREIASLQNLLINKSCNNRRDNSAAKTRAQPVQNQPAMYNSGGAAYMKYYQQYYGEAQ